MQETRNRETGLRWRLISGAFSLIYSIFRRLVAVVNEEQAVQLGAWMIRQIHGPLKDKRRANYRRFFGTADPQRDDQLDAGYFDYMGRLLTECIRDYQVDPDVYRARTQLVGQENLEAALKLGRGAILLNGHVGNYYASHAALALAGYKVTSISERLPIGSMERQINRLRKRYGVASTFVDENAARTAIKTFRNNGIFSIFFEIAIRRDKTVTLPFGQGALSLDLGPALLAVRYNVPVLPMSVRSDRPYHHHVQIHPPLPAPIGADEKEQALHFLETWRDWLQNEVHQNPTQWWPWFLEDFLLDKP